MAALEVQTKLQKDVNWKFQDVSYHDPTYIK